jgi:hypothetical protein
MYGVTVEYHHHTRLGSPPTPPLLFGKRGSFSYINTEKVGCDFIFVGLII